MYNLTGEYECKMDDKGRLKLPSQLVRQLGGDTTLLFTINRGFEKCLVLYPKDVWEQKTRELNQLNTYVAKNRQFIRYFYRGATQVATDAADRILIPKNLIEHGNMDKDVVLLAYKDQVEIWSKEQYNQMLDSEPEDFAQLAEDVFGSMGSGDND